MPYWNFFVFEWSFPVVMKPSRYSFLLHKNLVKVVIRANLSWLIEPWVSCFWGFTFPNCNCIICPVVAEIRSGWCWCRRLTSTVSSLTLSHARALLLSRWSFLGAKFGLRLAFCPLERSRVFRSPCLHLCVCFGCRRPSMPYRSPTDLINIQLPVQGFFSRAKWSREQLANSPNILIRFYLHSSWNGENISLSFSS